jgi:hypothetical protein
MAMFRSINFFCGLNIMRVAVAMAVAAVGMVMEKDKTKNVRQQSSAPHEADQFRVLHLLRFHQSLYRFEEDGQAKSDEEYTVDERTERFGALPLKVPVLVDFATRAGKGQRRDEHSPRRCTSWKTFRGWRP